MPTKKTARRARQAKRERKSPSTQAGEFVREEMHHIRKAKHGARSAKQAIAIGLSKARRAGVDLPPPETGEASEETRASARRDLRRGRQGGSKRTSAARSRAVRETLEREGRSAASHRALSRHGKSAARERTAAERSAAAKKGAETKGAAKRREAARKAVRTKGAEGLSRAARKAAQTRKRRAET